MPDHATTPPTAPPPIRRLLWTKRLLLGLGLLVLTALVARFWAGHIAERRYAEHTQAMTDAGYLDASGQPIEPAWVDPLENKATFFEQAQQAWPKVDGLRLDQSAWWYEGGNFIDDNPLPDPVEDSAAYLAKLGPLFEAHKRMVEAPEVSWDGDFSTRWVNIRTHNDLLEDAASRAAGTDDFATATRLIQMILETQFLFDIPNALSIDGVFSSYVRSRSADLLSSVLPYLTSGPMPATEIRATLDALLMNFLAEDQFKALVARGLNGDKIEYYGHVEGFRDGSILYGDFNYSSPHFYELMKNSWGRWLVDPMLLEDAANYWAGMNESRQLILAQDNLKAFVDYDASREPHRELDSLVHPLLNFWSPFYLPMYERHFRSIAMTRMAAAAIAIKLYELDHGQRPDTLAALVPDYLPAVPDDPFLGQGHPIQYRPEGVTPHFINYHVTKEEQDTAEAKLDLQPLALLYCVGTDLHDNRCPLWVDDRRQIDSHYGHIEDQYFLLDHAPRPLADSVLPPHLQEPEFGSDWYEYHDAADPLDQPQEHDEVEEQGGDEPEQDGGGEQP